MQALGLTVGRRRRDSRISRDALEGRTSRSRRGLRDAFRLHTGRLKRGTSDRNQTNERARSLLEDRASASARAMSGLPAANGLASIVTGLVVQMCRGCMSWQARSRQRAWQGSRVADSIAATDTDSVGTSNVATAMVGREGVEPPKLSRRFY